MSAAVNEMTGARAGQGDRSIALLLAVVASACGAYGVPMSIAGLKKAAKDAIANDPMDAVSVTVLGGAYLFYLAEKGHNPKVTSYFDALVFVSTCLSVGYADIFARTPAGKAIATALMTFGPALSGAVLEEHSTLPPLNDEQVAIQRKILEKLDAILGELKAQRS
jgi:hypothetical protein